MEILNRWERKVGWLAFPGLLRYYALFHVLVFLLQFVNPEIGAVLSFDKGKILQGEVWRVFTFLFADSGSRGLGAFSMLFLFFMVSVAFMMSDALEGVWGVFRTSCFYYMGFLGLLVANFLYPVPMPGSGFFIYTAAFFAFATLFPRQEFLFFVIPVQVRWLAIIAAIPLALTVLPQPLYFPYVVISFSNYLLWAGIPALRGGGLRVSPRVKMPKSARAKGAAAVAFHSCKVCGRTEISDPQLEFRICADGEEYCEDHLIA